MPAPKDQKKREEWIQKITGVNKITWTDEEDAILRAHYSLDIEEVCKLLPGRSANAINGRARRLKLYKIPHHHPPESLACVEKFCTKCKKTKPLSGFPFIRHTQKYRSHCKECRQDAARKYIAEGPRNKAKKLFLSETEKQCAKCMRILPLAHFYKARFGRSGLHSQCKVCRDAYHSVNYRVHKYERRTQRAEYRKLNKNIERNRQARRRARKKSVQGSYTQEQIQEQLKRQGYRCYYAACGHAEFKKKNGQYIYQIDHTFPLSRVAGTDIPANDMSYLVLACPTCNASKGSKFPWEWPEGGRLL